MMQTYPPRTEEEVKAETTVWWDINRCPVPGDVNPRLIGPFIKDSLKNIGYSGRLTITAIGILTEVDNEVLQALCSTGVSLYHIPTEGVVRPLCRLLNDYPPPANLMVLSRQGFLDQFIRSLSSTYNILGSIYPERSIRYGFARSEECYLWETFLADIRSPTTVREPLLPEAGQWRTMAGPALFCGSCKLDLKGFQSFANHLCSKEHALKDLHYQPFGGARAAFESKGLDADAIRGMLKRLREAPRQPLYDEDDED
ncbi:unnamed protein product [Microthlaspi erraticum]|uniref:NYN domain-containing protein n=1 Tax=Microthlaspi erraticum TaxID=1685480 RepID=A0A6D2IMV8_9BRAS|nr:unnamed protein product [Microthlaspi erraticum]